MGNQKRKSSDIEKEIVVMNDENQNESSDTDPESPPGFSLSEPPISGHRNQRNVARSSMDKGKSKMVATPGKLPFSPLLKPCSYLVTKSTPPPSRPPRFQFTKAPKKKLATVQGRIARRKFHEECYYDFKAFVHPLTKFSTELCCRYFWSHSWCLDHSSILA
ncbi:hypothetical protein AAG906_024389 [Vitis piasezkii]